MGHADTKKCSCNSGEHGWTLNKDINKPCRNCGHEKDEDCFYDEGFCAATWIFEMKMRNIRRGRDRDSQGYESEDVGGNEGGDERGDEGGEGCTC